MFWGEESGYWCEVVLIGQQSKNQKESLGDLVSRRSLVTWVRTDPREWWCEEMADRGGNGSYAQTVF